MLIALWSYNTRVFRLNNCYDAFIYVTNSKGIKLNFFHFSFYDIKGFTDFLWSKACNSCWKHSLRFQQASSGCRLNKPLNIVYRQVQNTRFKTFRYDNWWASLLISAPPTPYNLLSIFQQSVTNSSSISLESICLLRIEILEFYHFVNVIFQCWFWIIKYFGRFEVHQFFLSDSKFLLIVVTVLIFFVLSWHFILKINILVIKKLHLNSCVFAVPNFGYVYFLECH